MDVGGDAARSNFTEILEQLDPLPELPESEDRFFIKDELDFQYPTAPAESPAFPTWGSTSVEMPPPVKAVAHAARAPAAVAAATHAMTPPPLPHADSLAAGSVLDQTTLRGGNKRALSQQRQHQHQQYQHHQHQHHQQFVQQQQQQLKQDSSERRSTAASAPVAGADRMVFLRQRLGGEIVSSGNSSTSTSSDNGSASDDVAGEWDGGQGHGGRAGTRVPENGVKGAASPFSRVDACGGGSVSLAAGSSSSSAIAAAVAAAAGSLGLSKRSDKGVVHRKRYGGPKPSGRHKKCSRLSSSGSWNSSEGVYVSWGALVKPFKQQWDHMEAPTVSLSSSSSSPSPSSSVGASKAGHSRRTEGGSGDGSSSSSSSSSSNSSSSSVCSSFSAEPSPSDATAFSVEQCSAQAHPRAVASYVLRVRCASGSHIVRRTWDDMVTLCTMIGGDLALPTATPPSAAAAAVDRNGASPTAVLATRAASVAAASVEFTPADVLAPDAASGFLKDLLARPGMAAATPARRFLELEFLDGTLRGGVVDGGRRAAVGRVVAMAATAASATGSAFPTGATAAEIPINTSLPAGAQPVTGGGSACGESTAAAAGATVAAAASMNGASLGASKSLPHVTPPRATLSLPAHPDAARDLAAVYRCLGDFGGAVAFPSFSVSQGNDGAAASSYWATGDGDGAAGGVAGGGGGLQRRVAALA